MSYGYYAHWKTRSIRDCDAMVLRLSCTSQDMLIMSRRSVCRKGRLSSISKENEGQEVMSIKTGLRSSLSKKSHAYISKQPQRASSWSLTCMKSSLSISQIRSKTCTLKCSSSVTSYSINQALSFSIDTVVSYFQSLKLGCNLCTHSYVSWIKRYGSMLNRLEVLLFVL